MFEVNGNQDQQRHSDPILMTFGASLPTLLACGLSLCFLGIKLYRSYKMRVDLPVVGGSGILKSWIAGIRYYRNARSYIQEGYDKHRDCAFQIATLTGWEIFICSEALIKEYWNLDSKLMSANAVSEDFIQTPYTLPGAADGVHRIDPYVVGKALTWQRMRATTKTDNYFPELYDEMIHTFSVDIPIADGDKSGWTVIPCFPTSTRMVTRMAAKALIGRPLCRNQELLELFNTYGNVVLSSGLFLRMFPDILKPAAASVCAAPKLAKSLESIILEVLHQRRANMPKAPNDLADWFLKWVDENPESGHNDEHVALQIVALVFGGMHTTAQILAHCLFDIAARKEYVEPLRQEVTQCLKEYGGWNKEALEAMKKLDSFTKECQRYYSMDAGALARRATKDFTFSNGLHIPAGNYIYAPSTPILGDPNNYPDPDMFDGFRYYRLRQEAGQSNNHTFASKSIKNLQFGDGRHSCPGRFMASDTIKLMMAHTIINYEVAIKDHGPRPPNFMIGRILLPNLSAEIMLRKIRT